MTNNLGKPGESTLTRLAPSDFLSRNWLSDEEKRNILGYFEGRFGIPLDIFNDYSLCLRGKSYWMLRRSRWIEELAPLPVETVGLMVLRKLDAGFKPTTVALQIFGKFILKNVALLTPGDFVRFLDERKLEIGASHGLERGYVAIKVGCDVVGCGYYRRGLLVSELPKSLFKGWILAPA